MTKLYAVKKGRLKFYACKYDSDLYSIDRITKGFGGNVKFFGSLEELETWASENGYKKIS